MMHTRKLVNVRKAAAPRFERRANRFETTANFSRLLANEPAMTNLEEREQEYLAWLASETR